MTSSAFTRNSQVPLWIDGKEYKSAKSYQVVAPASGDVLYDASAASVDDAIAAVNAADKAFETWSQTKPSERRDLLLAAAAELVQRKDEFWQYCSSETASVPPFFEFDFNDAVESLKSAAGLIAPAIEGSIPTIAAADRSAMLVQEPYGVVVSIAPWNAPCILGLRAFLAPLAMGNTVVLKGSEKSPAVYWALASVFHKVGLPAGCLNTINHAAEDGRSIIPALINADAVKKISFTGSTAVGSIVAGLAGKALKPVLMELGGKAPAIVCEDADLEQAALQCALGSFLYSGQVCMATERIVVHAKVVDQFRAVLKGTIDAVFSDPNGLVLIDKAPVQKNASLLQDAISKGATALYGDPKQTLQSAAAMRPVVLEGVQPGMDLYYTESFGPTVSLMVVENDEAAIKIANDTNYGLSSAVFTTSLQRGLKIAKQIETGAVHVNSMTIHDETTLPHGGAKSSGFGRFNGLAGMKEWIRTKTITWQN